MKLMMDGIQTDQGRLLDDTAPATRRSFALGVGALLDCEFSCNLEDNIHVLEDNTHVLH